MILLIENSHMYEEPLQKCDIEFACLKSSDINAVTFDEHTLDPSTIDTVLLGSCSSRMRTIEIIRKIFDVPIIAVLENRSTKSLINLYLHGVDEVILMDNCIEEFLKYRRVMIGSN